MDKNMEQPGSVVIGMDPHKRTVTIEVMTPTEVIVGGGRFTTDEARFAAMVDYVRQWPSGRGRSRGVRASAATWPPACCRGVSRSWTSRPSCRPGFGSSPPGTQDR